MLVKDQIRSRMTQLGISVPALAKQLGVSEQSVRFWLAGRNLPGKRHAAKLEAALSCTISWTESPRHGERPMATNLLEQADVEIMLKMSKLPMSVKILFGQLAEEIARSGMNAGFAERSVSKPMKSFSEKSRNAMEDLKHGKTRRRSTTAKKAA